MTPVGVVGLGLMGSAVAARLISAGLTVVGTSRTEGSRRRLADLGGEVRANAAAVAEAAELVLVCVPDGGASRSVCLGTAGIVEGARTGSVVFDMTTSSPDEAVATGLALAEHEIAYHDVGISGSSQIVAQGRALALVGGPLDDDEPARRVLSVLCEDIVVLPRLGDGMRTKLVVNHVHGLNRLALAEGLVLAERNGLDMETALGVLRRSAAASRALEAWGEKMAAGRHDQPVSTIRTGRKDAALVAALASPEAAAPAWQLFAALLDEAVAGGLADHDNSAIIEVLRRRAGIGRVVGPRQDGPD